MEQDLWKKGRARGDYYDCLLYAGKIATSLWENHWKESSPQWQPENTLWGVLSQIDNMTCGSTKGDD